VLFSTSSFTVDIHYCGGNLIDIGIFEQAETCNVKFQKSKMDNCEDSSESCCHNDKLFKTGNDNLEKLSSDINFIDSINFIETHFPSFVLYQDFKENIRSIINYRPPLLTKDILILDETYLI
jgi:hypothetical protein